MIKKTNEELSERDKFILDAIVNDYISSSEPVGSRTICKKYNLNLSPATIRNIASDLEESGYLTQTHVSSGRLPTDKGFRSYVDRLMHLRGLSKAQKNAIDKGYDLDKLGLKKILEETSKVLSKISHNVGLVLAPKLSVSIFEHIEFIMLSKKYVLVVFVTKTGVVYNKKVKLTGKFTQGDLHRASNYLSKIMQNLNLYEIRKKIVEEIKKEKTKYDHLFLRALNIFKEVVDNSEQHDNLYIEGALNIIGDPVFKNVKEIKRILSALENKKLLINILDRSIQSDGTAIFIGEENDSKELMDLSVVSSNYSKDGNVLGTLGVIGPRRMDYARVIPLVDYMSKQVSRLLEIID